MNTTALLLALVFAAKAPPPLPASASVSDLKPLAGNANLLVSGVPAVPSAFRERVMQYSNARMANLLDVSADGQRVLVSTRFASTNQLHVVEQPLGARTQLTFTDEPINRALWVPGDMSTLFFLQDKGGGEFFQVHRLDLKTGRSTLVTDGKSRHEQLIVSRDGKTLAYGGTGRNGKDTDVYVAPVANPTAARRVVEAEGTWRPLELSADGKKLLVLQYRSISDADLHVVDVATGERTQLTPKDGPAGVRHAAFSRDAKTVYFVTDRYSDFHELYQLAIADAGKDPKPLTRAIAWNVERVDVSPDGKRLVIEVNEDGYSRLKQIDAKSGRMTNLNVGDGVIGGVKFPDGRSDLIAYSMQSPNAPSDVWMLDLKSGKRTQWTRSEVGGLDARTFVTPQLVRYPSTDEVKVPALVFRPRGTPPGGKWPVVVIWHGGPESQSQPTFSTFVQLLVTELELAVVVPNVRGSDGYGKRYLAMDDGVRREQALADIDATLQFIAGQGDLDARRVGAYGGSYGGYMTLASVAFFPDRFHAAVDVVGISNLVSFLNNTQAYRRDLRRAEYGDERKPEVRAVLERISPLNSVNRIQASLFVLQGKNDPRVPQSEAEQIVRAMRENKKDVWYLLALNEGHGFGKKENRDEATTLSAWFLKEKLSPPAEPVPVR